MKKTWIISITAILLLIFAVLYYNRQKPEIIPTVAVTKGDITEYAEAIGYIKPQHSSTVKSQVDGIVAKIYHDEGEYVKKGTSLIKVDPSPSPEIYASVHQQLSDAKAKEIAAVRDLTRFKKALKLGLIENNYADYIAAKKDYESAKSSRILAEQKLALYEKGNTVVAGKTIANIVTSPTDGYILERDVDIGDPVISLSSAQSSTALFTVANMRDFMFQGIVDEMDAAKIALNMQAIIIIGSLPGKPILGNLSKIALQSENASSSDTSPFNVGFKVEITHLKLPADLVLRSGYSATAKIKIKTVKNILILPTRVIQFKDEKPYVLLPAAKKDGNPKPQPVTLGVSDGINTEIKSGVKVGEKILDKQEITADNENN